ncbi:MAG: hypothetical protein MUC65_06505 [Pontiellaceae bacterium]|jgi:hypothetical protein|nr:hypothetical protein [Pontiellaceae bacterium]
MKMNTGRLMGALIAVVGLLMSPAFAQDGADSSALSAGKVALDAATAVYADNTDPAVIQQKLTDILNQAAVSGDQEIMKHVIVAVMLAGGVKNQQIGKAAVDNSDIYKNYKELAVGTVAYSIRKMNEKKGDGNGAGNGTGAGGPGSAAVDWDEKDLNAFLKLYSRHGDNDLPATGV